MAILSPCVLVNFSYDVLSAREINLTLFHDTDSEEIYQSTCMYNFSVSVGYLQIKQLVERETSIAHFNNKATHTIKLFMVGPCFEKK